MATVQRKLVHKQFNSPIGLYSDENVKETLDRELRAISNGAVGIETSDQHRPVNLSNSAVLKMLEEQEGERISASNERKSRPRQRGVIDRETVLKINRRHQRRRDVSWPPPKSENSQSRSSSEEIHFDDKVRKRREIAHLKEMFEGGPIRREKRENISRLLSPEDVLRRAPEDGNMGKRENLSNVYNICSGKGATAPRSSVCPSGDESPVNKTFHLPENELHIGLIEPIRKYFEEGSSASGKAAARREVIHAACLSALKRWKSYDSVARDSSPAGTSINEQFGNMRNNNPALKRYKSTSYTELPPLKPPRRESNKNEPPTKEKLNFNNLKKFPEDYNMEQAAKENDGKNPIQRDRNRSKSDERKLRFHESAEWPRETPVFGTNLITKNKSARRDNNSAVAADSAAFSNDHEYSDDVTSAIKNRRATTASNISGLNNLSCNNRNECITAPSSKCREQKIVSLGHQPRNGGDGGERPCSDGSSTTIGCGGENSRENKTKQPESYDLASESRSDAKNSRSHNLSTQLNEHVNIVASNRRTTTTRTCPAPSNEIKSDGDGIMKNFLQMRVDSPAASRDKTRKFGGNRQPNNITTTNNGGNSPQKSDETYDSRRHTCHHHFQDFVDDPIRGSHKPKCDENLQEPSTTEEQGNIARMVRRSPHPQNRQQQKEHRLEDNDDYMGIYNQREISKSGLSVSASVRRDRGRGVFYTDGEFIWGPFDDTSPFNEISVLNNKRNCDIEGIPEKDSALSSNGTNSLNFHKASVDFERKQHFPAAQQIGSVRRNLQNADMEPQMEDWFKEDSEIEGDVEQKLLDIQKSIAEDLQRIHEYMETAESALCDAEKHLIESSLSESAYVLDTPIQAAIKEILEKRTSPLSAPETGIQPRPIRQISYFGPEPIRPENIPETKHALVDLYKMSRTLDALNNLIRTDSSVRITEIDDSEDGVPAASVDDMMHKTTTSILHPYNEASQPKRSSSSTSDSEAAGATTTVNVDKIIQSKNILSGYLITKQNQEQIFQKAALCDPTVGPENENTNVIVDLANGKIWPSSPRRWPPPTRTTTTPTPLGAPSNDPLKIDEKDDYSVAAVVAAPDNGAHLTGKSDCPDERRKFYEAEEKSSPPGSIRQLSHRHPCTEVLTTARYDTSERISCDDTINKYNKFCAGRNEDSEEASFSPANETLHRPGLLQYGGRNERVTPDNPNTVSAIRSGNQKQEQQSAPYSVYRHREQPQTGNEPAHFDVMKSNGSESGGTAHDYRWSTGKQTDRQNAENEIKEKLDCERSLSSSGNYSEGDYCRSNYTDESPRNKTRPDQFNRSRGRGASNKFRSSSQPSTPLPPNLTRETSEDLRQKPLVRQHSFDSSERRYFASPSLFMTGHFCPTEGYKRVAWPPVSEGTPVKGSTPQPQQPQYQGGQNYYSQPTQPQYPQQYGGQSPQPQQQQQQQAPKYYQQQHHQPRQDSNLYQQQQQQQPNQPEQSYNRPQGGQQPSQGFRPVQPSTVAFTGGAAQKHIPSLPGQPNYPPVEQPLPQPITFPQNLPTQYGSGGQYSPQPQYQQSQPSYQQNQPSYQQNQPSYQQVQPQYRAQQSPQPQYAPQGQYGPQSQSPYLVSPSGQRSEPVSTNPPRGWSHVTSPTPTRTGYTQGPPNYPTSANLPQFGSESHFGPHQSQNQQSYESPVSHQPSYGQQYPQQKYSEPQQQYYPQGQPQYQFDRGQSPGVIHLRKEAPVSQQPAPVVTSQPAARNFRGGSNMRGDLKWPPPEVKAQMDAEEEQRRSLATGPAIRPRRVNKDYTKFFAQHALNSTYPGYKIPPGTQHVYAEF